MARPGVRGRQAPTARQGDINDLSGPDTGRELLRYALPGFEGQVFSASARLELVQFRTVVCGGTKTGWGEGGGFIPPHFAR